MMIRRTANGGGVTSCLTTTTLKNLKWTMTVSLFDDTSEQIRIMVGFWLKFLCLLLLLKTSKCRKKMNEESHHLSSFLRQTNQIKPVDLSLQGT